MRITSLQWAVGGALTVLGALILLAPHEFTLLNVGLLGPYGSSLAALCVLGGLALVGTAVFQPARAGVWMAHLLGKRPASRPRVVRRPTRVGGVDAGHPGLGGGDADSAALRWGVSEALPPGRDFWSAAIGFSAVATGIAQVFWPTHLGLADPQAVDLQLFSAAGAARIALGPSIIAIQFMPSLPLAARRAVHLVFAAAVFTPIPLLISTGIWDAIFPPLFSGTTIALVPWLTNRRIGVGATSLRARLAFALAVAAVVPILAIIDPRVGAGRASTGERHTQRPAAIGRRARRTR